MEEIGAPFQVDLRGVVDLLARHLYSGPNVYLRELLQNGVDAITARRALEPEVVGSIRIRSWDGDGLEIVDDGIGLTTEEARELLATVGHSSKRDLDLGVGRGEFLGQFGIGLLSGFMVADSIELISRSAKDLTAKAVKWTGHDDGHYDLTEIPRTANDPVGSVVHIKPRRGMEHWLTIDTVVSLAEEFGCLLPVDVAVEVPLKLPDGTTSNVWRRTSEEQMPWLKEYPHDLARREALGRFCEETMGYSPMAAIDLNVPITGLTGVAFVIPDAVPPGSGGFHRVYLKQMLLGSRVAGLVPEWAFFVRCAIDATGLAPTASREQLYSDDALLATQEALADQIRAWVVDTLSSEATMAKDFIHTHHLALRTLALTDDVVLDLAAEVLPYETTEGIQTLREVMDQQSEVVYTSSVEEFKQVGAVARAQGITLVNAGYVYDGDLMNKLATRPQFKIRAMTSEDIAQVLTSIEPVRELEIMDKIDVAKEILAPLDIQPVVRQFEPEGLPAMILMEDAHHISLSNSSEGEDSLDMDNEDVWSEVIAEFDTTSTPGRTIILNDTNATVQRWLSLDPHSDFFRAGLQSMYVSAMLLSGEPLRPREAEMMNDSLETFLRWGLPNQGGASGSDSS